MANESIPHHARLLRAARSRAGKKGSQVAAVLGVHESTYRNAERGAFGKSVFESEKLPLVFKADDVRDLKEAWRAFTEGSTPEQVEEFSDSHTLIPVELLHGLAESRVTRFHPSRKYYKLLRGDGRATISGYVGQALHSLEMVSLTLATGMELERVIDTFESLIVRQRPVKVTVSLLDLEEDHLMKSIAPVIGASGASLAGRIQDTIDTLSDFRRDRLPSRYHDCLEVHAHKAIPNASVIMLDANHETGLLQLETKGYKLGMEKSFGFEVGYGSDFYVDLRDSYRHLIRDGRRIL